MIDFTVKGAIFDVDDTLLDNQPGSAEDSLHARSRLAAIHEAGKKHNIPSLATLTKADNLQGFLNAPVHSLQGAVWHIMHTLQVVESPNIDNTHHIFSEIIHRKNELYGVILQKYGVELPGAVQFVRSLSEKTNGSVAIASSAIRCDINTFFEMVGLDSLFPEERIVSLESVNNIKPHPESFDRAFSSLGLTDDDRRYVCAFEDDPRGIRSAHAAGLFVCAVTSRYSKEHFMSQEVVPDLVADSYAEFTQLFGL